MGTCYLKCERDDFISKTVVLPFLEDFMQIDTSFQAKKLSYIILITRQILQMYLVLYPCLLSIKFFQSTVQYFNIRYTVCTIILLLPYKIHVHSTRKII